MPRIPIVGYADRFSLQPGETIEFKVSSGSAEPYAARLVRVISGDPSPEGPGLIEQDIEADFAAGYPSRFQPSHLGSYMQVTAAAPLEGLESFTFGATIGPTTPDRGQQGVIGRFWPAAVLARWFPRRPASRWWRSVGIGSGQVTTLRPDPCGSFKSRSWLGLTLMTQERLRALPPRRQAFRWVRRWSLRRSAPGRSPATITARSNARSC